MEDCRTDMRAARTVCSNSPSAAVNDRAQVSVGGRNTAWAMNQDRVMRLGASGRKVRFYCLLRGWWRGLRGYSGYP